MIKFAAACTSFAIVQGDVVTGITLDIVERVQPVPSS
jgi:hypothetical protein